MDWKAQGWIGE